MRLLKYKKKKKCFSTWIYGTSNIIYNFIQMLIFFLDIVLESEIKDGSLVQVRFDGS